MRRLPRVAFGVPLLLAGCGDATGPLPSEGVPREFTYTTNGFVATTYDARLAGDTVVFTSRTGTPSGPRETVTRRVPTADDWRTFWRTVNDAGVRRWPAECRDTSGLDGGEFTFTLAWAGGRRSGTYVNLVPTRQGTCTGDYARSGDAALFQEAVFALAGISVYQALNGA